MDYVLYWGIYRNTRYCQLVGGKDSAVYSKTAMKNFEPSEHQIQNAILEWLQYKGWMVWRNNSGVIPMTANGKTRLIKMGMAGLPDLFALKDGFLLGVEVKRPGNKPTVIQERMLFELRNHGAGTCVAHSVEELETWLKLC